MKGSSLLRLALPSLVLVAMACSSGGGSGGGGGSVTIQVYITGSPGSSATVIHQDPNGNALETVTPDATGLASVGNLAAGDMITAVWTTAGQTRLVTFLGVKPGDKLQAGARFDRVTLAGTITVHLPGVVSSASRYETAAPAVFAVQGRPRDAFLPVPA